jgi:anti-sigma-K factor RskA
VIAVGAWWLLRNRAAPTPAEARAELLATSDATRLDWKATPEAASASGDVVWSRSAQRGFMRFVGLPANDPSKTQYQLWIFDRQRDQAFPVDGGVFDVTSTGEVLIPITAKLRVDDATLFAVTVERPGGVVVSRREHIVVTAARS